MTFDLYIPFLLVKHHSTTKNGHWTRSRCLQNIQHKKQTGGGREYDKESDKGVHVHFWAPRLSFATIVTVDTFEPVGECLLKDSTS